MTEREALLQEIIDNPDADLPRLVYADWLEEFGGETERAEFIRIQCELMLPKNITKAGNPRLRKNRAARKRERELLLRHCDEWSSIGLNFYMAFASNPHRPIHNGVFFRRGFIEVVSCVMNDWIEHGPKLVRDHPIKFVKITDKRTWNVNGEFIWFDDGDTTDSEDGLPEFLYDLLEGYASKDDNYGGKDYRTEEEASSAFSTACLKWAKQKKDKTND